MNDIVLYKYDIYWAYMYCVNLNAPEMKTTLGELGGTWQNWHRLISIIFQSTFIDYIDL